MAKRVNKRFLTILTLSVMGLLGAGVVLTRVLGGGNADALIARGDECVKLAKQAARPTTGPATTQEAKDTKSPDEYLNDAKTYYAKAAKLKPGNLDLWIKYGDVRHELAKYDWTEVGKDMQAWQQAVEADPQYLPALQRLMNGCVVLTELRPTPESYVLLGQRAAAFANAKQLAKVNDRDVRPQAYGHIAVIGAWLAKKSMPESVIEKELAALEELVKGNAEEADIPWFMARAMMRLAVERMSASDPAGARKRHQEAVAVFDEPLKTQKQNAVLLYNYFRVVMSSLGLEQDRQVDKDQLAWMELVLGKVVGALDEDQKAAGGAKLKAAMELLVGGKPAEANQSIQGLLGMLMEKAARLVKPEQPEYVDVRLTWASLLASEDIGKAIDSLSRSPENVKKEEQWKWLGGERCDDQEVRLAVASYLRRQPGKLQKAVELLALPFDPRANRDCVGFRADLIPQLELRRLVDLANLRLDVYQEAGEGERPGLRREIEDGYARATGRYPTEHPALLNLKGKMLLTLDGGLKAKYEAIRLLQKAYDKVEGARGRGTVELEFLLAQCYANVGETGQARSILSALVERQPGATFARKWLLQLMLRDRDAEAAELQVKAMEQRTPDDPDVKMYRVALLRMTGKAEEAKKLAAGLPQDTDRQKLLKAQELLVLGELEAGQKLLVELSQAELQKGEKAYPASQALVQAYLSQKKQPEAMALIGEVQKKLPQDVLWRTLAAMARGDAKPDEMDKLNQEALEGIADEASRALSRYDLMIRQKKPPEDALVVLLDAEKKMPKSGQIVEAIFRHYLVAGTPDRAEEYAGKLAKLDWDQVGGLNYQTRLKLAKNDIDGALSGALEISRRLPEFSRTWVLLGQAQQAAKQYEAAIGSYGKALDRQADNGQALLGLVQCHLATGQDKLVRKYVEQGKKLGVGGANFAEWSTRLDERSGDVNVVKEATKQREKELEQNRERIEAWGSVANDYMRLASLLSREDAKAAGDYLEKARVTLSEALKKWPDEVELYRGLSDLLLRTGKVNDGIVVLEQLKARENWKDKPAPLVLLARYQERMGDEGVAKAEQAWLLAGNKSPKDAELQRQIADFYVRTGQLEKAIKLLGGVVAETKDLSVRKKLVDVQVMARLYEDAEKSLGDVLKQTPSDPEVLSLLGWVKAARGDYAGAKEQMGLALKADADYPYAYYRRGTVSLLQGEVGAAVGDLEKARDLRPREADFRVGLADAYWRRNQMDEAARELEAAVQLAPLRADIRLKLVQFYAADRRWMLAQRLLDEAKANPELRQDPIWLRTESGLWLAQGELQKAYDTIVEARKLAPRDTSLLNDHLSILIKAEGYDHVIKLTDELLAGASQSPTLWWLYMQRGLAFGGLKKTDEAVKAFERALSAVDSLSSGGDEVADAVAGRMVASLGVEKTEALLSPRRNVRWKITAARIQVSQRNWAKAVKTMDELVGSEYDGLLDGQKLTVLRLCGPGYHAAGAVIPEALLKAEQVYNRYLLELAKHKLEVGLELEALNNLALLLAEHPTTPNPTRALNFSLRAYEITNKADSFNPGVADTHGWVLVLCGKVDEGIALLKKAAERQSFDAYYHLGQAYLKKSRPVEARQSLEEAKRMLADPKVKAGQVEPQIDQKIDGLLEKAKQMSEAGEKKNG
ncbi:MAG: tetratricopeptide repeat protein [Planctomycetota bacterium]|nr:tetratricopeptide repeat protein [Planctomycetota bacterium]